MKKMLSWFFFLVHTTLGSMGHGLRVIMISFYMDCQVFLREKTIYPPNFQIHRTIGTIFAARSAQVRGFCVPADLASGAR